MTTTSQPALIVLADGATFTGRSFAAAQTTFGEAVFTTAMTGYQEALTDPSYHRQLVVMAAPQIGNTGWNDEDNESRDGKIYAAGLIIRDLAHRISNYRATTSLTEALTQQNIPGVYGVDTRSLVRHLRNQGTVRAGIFVGDDARKDVEELLTQVRSQPGMEGADLTREVTTDTVYTIPAAGETKHRIVAYDLGIKTSTPAHLAARGIETIVVPAGTPVKEILAYEPEGVFLSNGPGDPATADDMVAITREILELGLPLFGICFGNQILGRALGLNTYKMTYGHRGINVPVVDHRTGEVAITSHNHGFALKAPPSESFHTDFGPARVTHSCLNDDCVEGIALENGRAFSVQFHPESAAGPHDANPLFDHFQDLLDKLRSA